MSLSYYGTLIKLKAPFPNEIDNKIQCSCQKPLFISVNLVTQVFVFGLYLLSQTLPKAQRTRGLRSDHITSSNTNLDQISSLQSRPSIKIKISTKDQALHKT